MTKLRIIAYYCMALLLMTSKTFAESPQQPRTYSNSQWGLSFSYPSSWDIYDQTSFAEKTGGLGNIPDAGVIVANTRNPNEHFVVQVKPVSSDMVYGAILDDMIESLEQQYQQRYQSVRRIHARMAEIAGAIGMQYLMDAERGGIQLKQRVFLLTKNNKTFVLTFTAPQAQYQRVEKDYFESMLRGMRIE